MTSTSPSPPPFTDVEPTIIGPIVQTEKPSKYWEAPKGYAAWVYIYPSGIARYPWNNRIGFLKDINSLICRKSISRNYLPLLIQELINHPRPVMIVVGRPTNSDTPKTLLLDDGMTAGFAIVTKYAGGRSHDVKLELLCGREDAKGMGGFLLRVAEETAKKLGAKFMTMQAVQGAVEPFYEKRGFVGACRGEVGCIEMWKSLDQRRVG